MRLITRFRDRKGRFTKFHRGRIQRAEYYTPRGSLVSRGLYKKRKKEPVVYRRIIEEKPLSKPVQKITKARPPEERPAVVAAPKIPVDYPRGYSLSGVVRGRRSLWNIIRVKYRVTFAHRGYTGRETVRWFSTVTMLDTSSGLPSIPIMDYIFSRLADLYEGYRLRRTKVKKITVLEVWLALSDGREK